MSAVTHDMSQPQETVSNAVDIATSIATASRKKERGNALFKSGDWEGAASEYLVGLAALPPQRKSGGTKGKARARGERPQTDGEDDMEHQSDEYEHKDDSDDDPPECKSLRAVLYANVAACRAKQGDDKAVVDLCTQALFDEPGYTKALHRRAAANERVGTWSALDAANADYATLLTLLPDSSSDVLNVQRAQRELAPRLEEEKKKEMDEMISKMKGFGNSILGKFGLSTDNFQFTPNGQGGYSMNFVNKP